MTTGEEAKAFKFINKLFPKLRKWCLQALPDRRRQKSCIYPLEDVFLLTVLMFLFRCRLLRAFTQEMRDNESVLSNLRLYFGINKFPSDDEFRYALQDITAKEINTVLQRMHNRLERRKLSRKIQTLDGQDLVALDGSGQISSHKIHCPKCLTKTDVGGSELFLHQELVASMVDEKANLSLTLAYEPIARQGTNEFNKNDCELNAGMRLLPRLKALYPKRKFLFLADALYSVTPIIDFIKSKNWNFLFTAKPERNKELFFMYWYLRREKRQTKFISMDSGNKRKYVWANGLPLIQNHLNKPQHWVNMLVCFEYNELGQRIYRNSWITNITITEQNVAKLVSAARARFTIENKTFNEQKNLGFNTEHNFGHFGNLPEVFFGAAQVAHLISGLFALWKEGKKLQAQVGSQRRFWQRLAVIFTLSTLPESLRPIFYLKFELNSS